MVVKGVFLWSRAAFRLFRFDRGCLMMWLLPQEALQLASWLSEWEGPAKSGSQEDFWRQRMIVLMKKRLEELAEKVSSGEETPFEVYSVHEKVEKSKKPLAMAMVSTRAFGLEPIRAMHLDQIVGSPATHARGRLDTSRLDTRHDLISESDPY